MRRIYFFWRKKSPNPLFYKFLLTTVLAIRMPNTLKKNTQVYGYYKQIKFKPDLKPYYHKRDLFAGLFKTNSIRIIK